AAISAAAGLTLAAWGARLLAWWNPASIPRVASVTVDTRVLLFTIAIALLTTIVFSLAPSIRLLRSDLTESMKEGGANATTGHGRQRFRHSLVVVAIYP